MPRPAPGVPNAQGAQRAARDRTQPVAPDDTYLLKVAAIRDMGMQKNKFSENDTEAPYLRISVVGEANGAEFRLSRDIIHSYDSRSTLCQLAAAILHIDPNDKDVQIDWRQLVNGYFLGQVKTRSYHPRVEGVEDPNTLHHWTEWKGQPMSVPAGLLPHAAAAPAQAPPQQNEPAQRPAAEDPGHGEVRIDTTPAFPNSMVTKGAIAVTGPVLRRVLDQRFGGDAKRAFEYFRDELARATDDPLRAHAACIQSFMGIRQADGRGVLTFVGRTDPDVEDLHAALLAYEQSWANAPHEDADVDPDDLPF